MEAWEAPQNQIGAVKALYTYPSWSGDPAIEAEETFLGNHNVLSWLSLKFYLKSLHHHQKLVNSRCEGVLQHWRCSYSGAEEMWNTYRHNGIDQMIQLIGPVSKMQLIHRQQRGAVMWEANTLSKQEFKRYTTISRRPGTSTPVCLRQHRDRTC